MDLYKVDFSVSSSKNTKPSPKRVVVFLESAKFSFSKWSNKSANFPNYSCLDKLEESWSKSFYSTLNLKDAIFQRNNEHDDDGAFILLRGAINAELSDIIEIKDMQKEKSYKK